MAIKKGGTTGGGGEKQTNGELLSSNDVRTGIIQLRTGTKAVQYSVVDGLAIFEGDIVLGTVQQIEQQTEAARMGLPEAVAITGSQYRWKNCRIPYTIDPALTNQARVTDAIAHWEAKTNYRFVVRTTEADYVTFRPGTGCSSMVGRQGGQQFVNLADGCLKGQTIHEIGHVIGLWHEQSREDRDTFVRIEWANIEAGKEHNFNQHVTDGDDIGPYDYGSIMHYGATAFTKNGLATIVPINPPGAAIGQRTSLSAGDIAAANSLCSGGLTTLKEMPKDARIETRKELVKDLIADTRKELIRDTRKELVLDKRFDPIDPFGPRKFDQIGPAIGGGIRAGRVGEGMLPFAMAAPHQAPGAMAGEGGLEASQQATEDAMQLDAQLQQIAEALAQAEAAVQELQQQYDQTHAILRQLVEDQGRSGS
jgi:hypothetical protein